MAWPVGGEIDPPTTPPAVPVWGSIDTGFTGTGTTNGLSFRSLPAHRAQPKRSSSRSNIVSWCASIWSFTTFDSGAGVRRLPVMCEVTRSKCSRPRAGGRRDRQWLHERRHQCVCGGEDGEVPDRRSRMLPIHPARGGKHRLSDDGRSIHCFGADFARQHERIHGCPSCRGRDLRPALTLIHHC